MVSPFNSRPLLLFRWLFGGLLVLFYGTRVRYFSALLYSEILLFLLLLFFDLLIFGLESHLYNTPVFPQINNNNRSFRSSPSAFLLLRGYRLAAQIAISSSHAGSSPFLVFMVTGVTLF